MAGKVAAAGGPPPEPPYSQTLFAAVEENDEAGVRALVSDPLLKIDEVGTWDSGCDYGLEGTALGFAVYFASSPTIIDLLLKAGANRSITTTFGEDEQTPLEYVVSTRRLYYKQMDSDGRKATRAFWIETFGQAHTKAWLVAVEKLLRG